MKPTKNNVLVKESPTSRSTRGGILLPDTAYCEQLFHDVVAVGNIDSKIGFSLNRGDKIIIAPRSGLPVECDELPHKIVDVREILAVVEN